MWIGTLFALAAGLVWGLVFVTPLWLPEYPPALLSCARYLAFGLVALPLAWLDRRRLRELRRRDWLEAVRLSLVGNLLYYGCLAGAIQLAGAPLPTMIIGTLPVAIALTANARATAQGGGRLPWRRLAPSLALIGLGIALVNQVELGHVLRDPATDAGRYTLGLLLALGALACWTWYPVRNAEWLRAHRGRSPNTWATAQGLVTLPLAALGLALFLAWHAAAGQEAAGQVAAFDAPLGPTPGRFIGLMLLLGFAASWLGTLCWNQASQRLPTTIAGQLIVFETLAALAYAFLWRGHMPDPWTMAGIAALVGGVLWALRIRPEPAAAAEAHRA